MSDERTTAEYQSDQDRARAWAAKALATPGILLLDTETTGLHGTAEIVQIAIIDLAGTVLLDTLVKPTCTIPPDASAIHGITDAMVERAPTFAEIAPQLRELLSGQTVIIYNADFDCRMLKQSAAAAGVMHERGRFLKMRWGRTRHGWETGRATMAITAGNAYPAAIIQLWAMRGRAWTC